jgi:voltage-gated potassium channel
VTLAQPPASRDRPAPRQESVPYLVFVLGLSVYALAALVFTSLVGLDPPTRALFAWADNAVCVLFLIDFLVTFARAENRLRYLVTWGWLDLLASIPAVDALRWGRAARALRILRVLRAIKATRVLTELLLHRRAQSASVAAALLSILLIFVGAAAVLELESDAAGGNIRDGEDALWWAMATMTTVGYGDRFPVTTSGRLVAAVLMAAGVGLFGTFSGLIASWLVGAKGRRSPELEALERVEAELRALRTRLDEGGGGAG